MQVECPKCHFRQPDDRFCAKCGIDMKSFVPPRKSFIEKVFQNSTLLFITGIIAISTATFVYLKKFDSPHDQVSSSRKTVFIAANKTATSHTDTSLTESSSTKKDSSTTGNSHNDFPKEIDKSNTSTSPNSTMNSTTTMSEKVAGNDSSVNPSKGSSSKNPTLSKEIKHVKLKIDYAEVTLKGFYFLEDEAKSSGQYSNTDYSQGVINFGNQKIKSQKIDIKIYSHDEKDIQLGKSEFWFQGLQSSNTENNIGLRTQLKVSEINESGKISAELKITNRFQVNLSDPNSKNFQSIDFIGSIDIAEDQYYFISNVLTTRPMTTQQDYLTSMSPFEILKSLNFKTGETISVFFYHFEK